MTTNNARWHGIVRPYRPEEVERLRPSVQIEHTLATARARNASGTSCTERASCEAWEP